MHQKLGNRIKDELMSEGKLCTLKGFEVVDGHFECAREANVLYYPLGLAIFAHETIGRLEAHTRNTVEVITATENSHLTELLICPAGKVVFLARCKFGSQDLDTVAIRVEFEEDCATAKDEEIRVFCDDAVDDTHSL